MIMSERELNRIEVLSQVKVLSVMTVVMANAGIEPATGP
jgi:hypothetical protein